jgi:L-amino acid N-acyltransferase YncA
MAHFSLLSPLTAHDDSVPAAVSGGLTVALRPFRAGDTTTLDRVFDGLSSGSRASRFMTPVPRLTEAMRRVLADVDGCRHVAWAAWVETTPVGIARYVLTAPRTAEVAFEVTDAWQGKGVGGALLDTVTTVAALNGVRRVQASVTPDNHRSLRLLRQVGLRLHADGGLLEGESPLSLMPTPRVDRPAVAAVALRHRPGAQPARSLEQAS